MSELAKRIAAGMPRSASWTQAEIDFANSAVDAELGPVREALRDHTITTMYRHGSAVGGHCLNCDKEWGIEQQEQHEFDCILATLATGEPNV